MGWLLGGDVYDTGAPEGIEVRQAAVHHRRSLCHQVVPAPWGSSSITSTRPTVGLALEAYECQTRLKRAGMPTYEYRCDKCGEHHEVVQSFRDDPLTKCPACGGPLRKVFGAIGVVFKGSGFYKTDSRSSAKAGDKASAKDAAPGKDGEKKAPVDASSATTKSKESKGSGADSKGSGSGTPAGSAAAAS